MTDYDTYDDDTDVDESEDRTVTLERKQIRSLERDAKQARKTAEENSTLKRQLAFMQAGIDPTDKQLAYFAKGYDGELTADAIKQAATDAGFLAPPAPDATAQADAAAHERMSNASAGATTQSPDTVASKVAELQEAARTGGRDAVLDTIRKHGHNIVS